MCQQEREVNVANPALLHEPHITDVVVIKEIRSQEQRRYDKGRDHAHLVCADIFLLDEIETRSDQHCCCKVQRRIDRRQIRDSDHKSAAASVNNFFMSSSSVPP